LTNHDSTDFHSTFDLIIATYDCSKVGIVSINVLGKYFDHSLEEENPVGLLCDLPFLVYVDPDIRASIEKVFITLIIRSYK